MIAEEAVAITGTAELAGHAGDAPIALAVADTAARATARLRRQLPGDVMVRRLPAEHDLPSTYLH